MEKQQMLQSSLQRLSSDVGAADASEAPTTTPYAIRRPNQSDDTESSEEVTAAISVSLENIAKYQSQVANDRKLQIKIQLMATASHYRRMILELDDNNPKRQKLEEHYEREIARVEELITDVES
jgi:hypothetical protein